ncbi:MAG: hypothetical protein KGM99_17360, partial [Burkholderiales bacterium]|nr:hypothetical protein [Burkholderiales bacterium]
MAEVDALRSEIARLNRELKTASSARDGFRDALQAQQAKNLRLEAEMHKAPRFDEAGMIDSVKRFEHFAAIYYGPLSIGKHPEDGRYLTPAVANALTGWNACFKEFAK